MMATPSAPQSSSVRPISSPWPTRWTRMDRYVSGLLFNRILLALALFTIIWLAPETLFKLTHYLFDGKITLSQFINLIGYNLPEILVQSIPLSTLFGSIFLFRALSLQLEYLSFLNAKIHPWRVLFPIALVGLLFVGIHLILQEQVLPVTAPRFDQLRETVGLRSPEEKSFSFVDKNEKGQWTQFALIGNTRPLLKQQPLTDFTFLTYQQDTEGQLYISSIVRAPQGTWNQNKAQWILEDGVEYLLNEDGEYKSNKAFSQAALPMNARAFTLIKENLKNPADMPFWQLNHYVQILKETGQHEDVPFYTSRLFQKLATPLASLVFVLIGAWVGMEKTRTNKHYALTFGVLLVFAYSILSPLSDHLSHLNILPGFLVAFLPLILTALFAKGLITLRERLENG